jgi:hypothetical protein
MKRNLKPFCVEIKKSRVQGQRSHLPPRRLFATTLVEVTKVFQKDEPQVVPEPSAAPRILPSIVEPVWSNSEPVEPFRRKRSSREANRGQIEFDLNASASGDVKGPPVEAPDLADAVSHADSAPAVAEGTAPVDDVQPAQCDSVKANAQKPRKKASVAVEQVTVLKPTSELEPRGEADMIGPSGVVTSGKADQPRLTKRQATVAQLPRHERWKRRLHPASW